jgi:enoyl-CoA hydratase
LRHPVNLVEDIAPAERLMAAARELADMISAKAPLGLRLGKKALNEIEFMPVEDGYAREQTYSTQLMHSEDARGDPRRARKARTGIPGEVKACAIALRAKRP